MQFNYNIKHFVRKQCRALHPGFDHSPIPVEFVVGRVAVGQVFLPVLRSSVGIILPLLHVPFHSYSSDVIWSQLFTASLNKTLMPPKKCLRLAMTFNLLGSWASQRDIAYTHWLLWMYVVEFFGTLYVATSSAVLDDWLTVHRSITLVDLPLDVQNSYLFTYNTFIKILYMFRALPCSSSGGLRRNCVYAASGIVTLCR